MTLPRMLAARRAAEIEPFQVMDVLARAQALEAAGRRVIHMEIGEPDFTAPQAVVEAGVRALRGGLTSYTATRSPRGRRTRPARRWMPRASPSRRAPPAACCSRSRFT
jgi:aspartate/methionine/tyrosine aminotransferase